MSGRVRVLLLMAVDLAVLFVVWAFTLWLYHAIGFGRYKFGFSFYWTLWPTAAAYILINVFFRLYHGRVFSPAAPLDPVEELRRLACSSVLTHLGTIAALAIAYQTTEHYSRAVILMSGMLTAVVAQPARNALRLLLHHFGLAQIPVQVIGDGESVRRVVKAISTDPYLGFKPVEESDIAIVCRPPTAFGDELQSLSQRFTHIEFVPEGTVFPTFGTRPVSFDGICGLELVNQRRMRVLRHEKWILDKVLSLLAFIGLLPFFIVVPLLVKLTSRGPVFYRQQRLGKRGRPIRVWKFRSMYADADERLQRILASDPVRKAEWEANFKLSDDPRVTPLGKFLRKTSIDEFPQLFNVFAGDMALVGPRPIVEKEVAYYGSAYETFSSVKPGITGLWQASGRSDTDYARRVALDVQYVLNWSPWMDIWILFRTVGAVLFMKGAR